LNDFVMTLIRFNRFDGLTILKARRKSGEMNFPYFRLII
jgi:hypothetical protein